MANKKGFTVKVSASRKHKITDSAEMQMFLHTRLKGSSKTKNKKGRLKTRKQKHKTRDF